jgi:hypothetical protein
MAKGSREPPFGLDMDFFEALHRFGQTDPKDVEESIERAKQKKAPPEVAPQRQGRKSASKSSNRDR